MPTKKKLPVKVLLDVLDRALRTVVQKFLVLSFASVPGVAVDTHTYWLDNLGVSLGAGVLSVLMSFATLKVPVLKYWPDLGVRMVRTYVQSLLVLVGADVVFNVFDTDWQGILLLAAATAGSSVLTSLFGAGVSGNVKSASFAFASVVDEAFQAKKPIAGDSPSNGGVRIFETNQGSGGSGGLTYNPPVSQVETHLPLTPPVTPVPPVMSPPVKKAPVKKAPAKKAPAKKAPAKKAPVKRTPVKKEPPKRGSKY
jgi:hypothetical protein